MKKAKPRPCAVCGHAKSSHKGGVYLPICLSCGWPQSEHAYKPRRAVGKPVVNGSASGIPPFGMSDGEMREAARRLAESSK